MSDLSDQRLHGFCIYCGQSSPTKEHVPARFLLDDPLPNNLHTVEACSSCNNSFSMDEEYLGCLLEAIIHGAISRRDRIRPKVRRTLDRQAKLAARIESSNEIINGKILWHVELGRISNVIKKLAQGHAAYDLAETALFPPVCSGTKSGYCTHPRPKFHGVESLRRSDARRVMARGG